MTIKELREKRNKLVADARAYFEGHSKAGTFKADESKRFEEMMSESVDLGKQIDAMERLEASEAELRAIDDSKTIKPDGDKPAGEIRSLDGKLISKEDAEKREQAFEQYLKTGQRLPELRALEAGDDTAGGYFQPSQQMANRLLKSVDDLVFIRQRAARETVTMAESLGMPSLTDPDDFDWTTELATGSEDSTMSFGKRELRPHPLAKRIKVSRTLLRKSARNVVDLINERFAYKLAITQEKAYLTGNGAGRPLGVFTASSNGISTSRDYSTNMTTTSMTADGLIGAKYTLKGAYWGGARWMFHRDGVAQIAKLKDGDGQYLFNAPENSLLGIPVDVNENAPNTFTTGQYVGILANWQSGYLVVDALNMSTQRLDELYAETNQIGFILRYEGDGAPVLEEAFVRVKLA